MNSQGNDVPGSPDPGNYTIGEYNTKYFYNNKLVSGVTKPIMVRNDSGVNDHIKNQMAEIQEGVLEGRYKIIVCEDVREWEDIPDIPQADLEEAIRIMDGYQLTPPKPN